MNKNFVDSVSRRLFFVPNPVEFKIKTENPLSKDAPWHPDTPDLGVRAEEINSGDSIYLPGDEIQDNAEIRLKNLCNVTVDGASLSFSGFDHKRGNSIFQWCS